MFDWFKDQDPAAQAALIAGTVTLIVNILVTPLRYLLDKRLLKHRLLAEYEQQQRKALRQLIGRYVARMVEAGEALDHRMMNLYKNPAAPRYLAVGGDYSKGHYYIDSFVHRLLLFAALALKFQDEAVFFDPRIALRTDLDFLKYTKAFRWALTDTALFDGLSYDRNRASDHFFRDYLTITCDAFLIKDRPVSLDDQRNDAAGNGPILRAYAFLDGLSREEDRLRWDRLVVFHLFVMAFLNTFGHDIQRSTSENLRWVAQQANHPEVLQNLKSWLPKLRLDRQKEGRHIVQAVDWAPKGRPKSATAEEPAESTG